MGVRAQVIALAVVVAGCNIRIAEQPGDGGPGATCGDFKIDPGEVCDDGNNADGDGCSADCKSDEQCGNGYVDTIMGETCDDGDRSSGDGCSADCKSTEVCGNGVIDFAKGETCDDGNLIGGDMCSANCQSNEKCGNGITDVGTNPVEECDDGPTGSFNCDVNCTLAQCGDGLVNPKHNEECDDANQNNGDACDNQCHNVICGNHRVDGNEQCDDGNTNNTDGCAQCRNAFCGDGFTQDGVEQCDDANADVTDGCTINCTAAFCGDGFIRAGVEQCDDSNQNNGDGCDSNCQFEPRVYVMSDLSCDPGSEECTSSQLIGFTTDCGDQTHPYDQFCTSDANSNPPGFSLGWQWNDFNTYFQPSQIIMEVSQGITCGSDQFAFTTLNGTPSGDFLFDSNPGGCSCFPSTVVNTWVFTGSQLDGYQPNTTNTLQFPGIPNCFGLGFEPNFGGFVKITVVP